MPTIQATTNYQFIHDTYSKRERYDVAQLEGSSRSSKSYSIAQWICDYTEKNQGKVITIGRDYFARLRESVYETLKKVWISYGRNPSVFNKSATPITYNGNLIRFVGVNEDIMRAHGMEQHILWLNECMNIPRDTFDQMAQRTEELTIADYNPSEYTSWLYENERLDNVAFKKSTFIDNPFAPEKQVNKILSYAHPDVDDGAICVDLGCSQTFWDEFKRKNLEMGTASKFKWQVYGLGMRASDEDSIFTDFEIVSEIPEDYDIRVYGGDFGFAQSAATFIQLTLDGNNLYIKQILYGTGMTDKDICIKLAPEYGKEIQVWDSAKKSSIIEMTRGYYDEDGTHYQMLSARPCKKFPGSRKAMLKKLLGYKIHIHAESKETIDEFRGYKYAKMSNGKYQLDSDGDQIAHKVNDHAIDATFYGLQAIRNDYLRR